MTPDRLVIRWAAVSALNNFMAEPYPTIAGPKIFDSRIEPVEDFKEDVVFPVCVIYTDYDRDHWTHQTNVAEPRTLTVTFELLIAQISEIPEDEGGGFMVSQPNTDSELETSLDIFEMQIVEALRADNEAADCWRYLMSSYGNIISRRGATVEGGTKLAARQVTIEARVPRGPANGTIVPTVAAFLDKLEEHDDYKERIPTIRSIYTDPASLSNSEQMMRVMGWPDVASGALGYQRGVLPVLGTPVVWLSPTGEPLS